MILLAFVIGWFDTLIGRKGGIGIFVARGHIHGDKAGRCSVHESFTTQKNLHLGTGGLRYDIFGVSSIV